MKFQACKILIFFSSMMLTRKIMVLECRYTKNAKYFNPVHYLDDYHFKCDINSNRVSCVFVKTLPSSYNAKIKYKISLFLTRA
ncbi:hypothetical protein V6Z12_D02G073800 [Gossypium hirsutum]